MTDHPSRAEPPGHPLTDLVSDAETGGAGWWEQIRGRGTPIVRETADGPVELIFLYRDPAASAVLVDLNGITDHHSSDPARLTRYEDTDVWWWRTEVRPDFRGSYCFVPLQDAADGVPPEESAGRAAHRGWWMDMLSRAVADPMSPHPPHRSSWDTPLSALHLPGAPSQAEWSGLEAGRRHESDGEFTWTSEVLGNQRSVWVHQVGTAAADQPVVVVLDGGHWARRTPLVDVLDAIAREPVTDGSGLPSCLVVLIDVIDMDTRSLELPCHAPFWTAVVDELLPTVATDHPFSTDPDRTIVAGQSFGGLAALYAGLTRPERFGRVITQSGSFWWPDIERARDPAAEGADGWLTRQLLTGEVGTSPVRVVQQVGRLEGAMNAFNDAMHDALRATGHDVTFTRFEGGHEWLCWRGGLVDGLRELLPPPGGNVD